MSNQWPSASGSGPETDPVAEADLAAHVAAADPHPGYQKESEKAQAGGYASLDGSGQVPLGELGNASGGADASTTVKGVSKLSTAPASPTDPIAAGDNDPRLSDPRVPTDGSVTAVKVNGALKPSGSAASTDESLRRLGTGATHAAAGDDSRFPSTGEKNALAGTSGTPGTGNKYVTDGDARNSNARTPTAHAASHGSGGSDPVTLAESQVTGLVADLAAKAQGLTPTGVKTATYAAVAGDFVPVDASGGSKIVNLPSAPADKTRIGVKMVSVSGVNTVTINRGGTDIFNKAGGSTSLTLSVLNHGVIVQYDAGGGIWYVLSTDVPLSQLDARFAGLASPALTGTPTVPTAAQGTNTTQAASTAYVQTEAGLLVPKSLVDAKGDLLVGTADNTVARKAVGSAGTGLVADPASSDGLAWGDSVNPPRVSGAYYGPHGTRTAATLATQDLEVCLVWLPAGAYDALMFELNTAGTATATFEPLVYDMSSGAPGAKLASGGQQNVGTGVATGQKIVLVSFTLTRTGWYWIGGLPLSTGTAPSLLSIGTFPTYWPSIPSTNNDSTFVRKLAQLTPPDPFGAISGYGTGGAVVRARAA